MNAWESLSTCVGAIAGAALIAVMLVSCSLWQVQTNGQNQATIQACINRGGTYLYGGYGACIMPNERAQ